LSGIFLVDFSSAEGYSQGMKGVKSAQEMSASGCGYPDRSGAAGPFGGGNDDDLYACFEPSGSECCKSGGFVRSKKTNPLLRVIGGL
jgi:hypothetical protein